MTESMDIAEAKLMTSLEYTKVQELNDSIRGLDQSAGHLNRFIDAADSNWHIMVAKLSQEKYKAHSAIAKSRVLIAEMKRHLEVLEHKLGNAAEKVKLDTDINAEKSLQTTPVRGRLEDKAQQTSPPRRRRRTRSSRRLSGKSRSNKSAISRSRSQSVRTLETPVYDNRHKIQSPLSSEGNYDRLNAGTDVLKSKTPVRRNLISIGTENKNQNPVFSKAVASNASSLESNRTISESIIAEFEKPFIKVPDNKNRQIPTIFNEPQRNAPPKAVTSRKSESLNVEPPRPGSFTAERRNIRPSRPQAQKVDPPKTEPPKTVSRKRKINPVSNVAAFKKPHELLSYKSHIIYSPPSEILANLKPLNACDPRTYYVKQALDSKTGPIKLTIARKFNQATAENENELRDNVRPSSEHKPQANDQTTHMQERDDTMLNRNASNAIISHLTPSTCHTTLGDANRGIPKRILNSQSENRLNTTPSRDVSNTFVNPISQIQNLAPTPTSSKTTGYKYKILSLTAEDSDSSSNSSFELRFSSSDISEPDVSAKRSSSIAEQSKISLLAEANSRSSTPTYRNGQPIENRKSSIFEKSKRFVPSPHSQNDLEKPSTPMSPDHPENDIARSYMKQYSNYISTSSENRASPISEKSGKFSSLSDQNKKLASSLPSETITASPSPAIPEMATIISESIAAEFENPFVQTVPDTNSRSSTPILEMLLSPYMSDEAFKSRSPSPIPEKSETVSSMLNNHTSTSSVKQGENTYIPTTNARYKCSSILDISVESDTSILSLDFSYSMSPTFTELSDDDNELGRNAAGNIILSPNTANCEGFGPAVLKQNETNRSKSLHVSVKSKSIASATQDMNRYTTDSGSVENRPTTSISVKYEKFPNTFGPSTENRTSSPNPTKSGRLAPTVTKIEEHKPQNLTRASIGNRSSTPISIKPERQDIYENKRTSSLAREKSYRLSHMSPDHNENIPSRSFKTKRIASFSQGESRHIVLSPIPDHPDNTISRSFKTEKCTYRSALNKSTTTSPARKNRKPISPMSPDHPENTVSRSFKTEIKMSAKDENRPIGPLQPVTENRRPLSPMSPSHSYENSQISDNKYPPSPKSLKYLGKKTAMSYLPSPHSLNDLKNSSTPMSPDHPENDVSRSFMKQVRNYAPTQSVSYIKEERNSPHTFSPVGNRQNYKSARDKYSFSSRSPRSPRLDRSSDVLPYSKHAESKNIYVPTSQRKAELRHVCVPSPPTYRRRSKPYRYSDRYNGSARKGHY